MSKPIVQPFNLGRLEWLALPDLGLPAIKAKVDTGARTSALHAFQIETFGPAAAPMVRFGVHPIPGRDDIEIYCSAPVAGMREVTSSNGVKERRIIITTRVLLGNREWPIEVGLTNRESMTYRMLLGRQAIGEDMIVEPSTSFRQPRLGYKLYRHMPRHDPVRRSLRIAFLTRKPERPSSLRIMSAARARGHVIEAIDPRLLTLTFDGSAAGLAADGNPLGHYDAVIACASTRRASPDVELVRQLEIMGSFALNGSDALARLANPVATRQALVRARIPCAALADAGDEPSRASARHHRFLLVDGRSVAGMRRGHGRYRDLAAHRASSARDTAEKAAVVLGLGLCAIDIAPREETPEVLGITARPSLAQFERATGSSGAEAIIVALEARARSWVRREGVAAAPVQPTPEDETSD